MKPEIIVPLPNSIRRVLEENHDLDSAENGELAAGILAQHFPDLIQTGGSWLDLGCGAGSPILGAMSVLSEKNIPLPKRVVLLDIKNTAEPARLILESMDIPADLITQDMFTYKVETSAGFAVIFAFNISELFDDQYPGASERSMYVLDLAAKALVLGGCLIFSTLDPISPLLFLASSYGFDFIDRGGSYFFQKRTS